MSSNECLFVKKLSPNAIIPTRGSPDAVGYDLYSARTLVLRKYDKLLVPTDIAITMPSGCYGRVAPRSGFSWKYHTITAAGVIDPDFRGNLNVMLFNHSICDVEIKQGDRIAQLILEKMKIVNVYEVEELEETARGDAGFGSTGIGIYKDP